MKAIFLLSLGLIVVTGCQHGLDKTTLIASREYQNRPTATASLFGTDDAVLRGANIEQILTSKVVIPPKARLAIMQFGQRRARPWWLEDFARLDEDLESGILAKLKDSKRLVDVSLLPSMMVPENQSIPYLREAAARCQADLLLVYRSGNRNFDKPRFLGPDQVKAKCLVEAILLDTRTGIVPFSSLSTQEYVARKSKEDYGFSETTARAELKAVSMGLEKIDEDLSRFLDAMP